MASTQPLIQYEEAGETHYQFFRLVEYAIRHHLATLYHCRTSWMRKNGFCHVFELFILRNFMLCNNSFGHERYQMQGSLKNIHEKTLALLLSSIGGKGGLLLWCLKAVKCGPEGNSSPKIEFGLESQEKVELQLKPLWRIKLGFFATNVETI